MKYEFYSTQEFIKELKNFRETQQPTTTKKTKNNKLATND